MLVVLLQACLHATALSHRLYQLKLSMLDTHVCHLCLFFERQPLSTCTKHGMALHQWQLLPPPEPSSSIILNMCSNSRFWSNVSWGGGTCMACERSQDSCKSKQLTVTN